jgi:hypothetical protein
MWKLTLGYGIHTHTNVLSLSSGKQKPAELLAPNYLKGVSKLMMDNQYNDNLQLRKCLTITSSNRLLWLEIMRLGERESESHFLKKINSSQLLTAL